MGQGEGINTNYTLTIQFITKGLKMNNLYITVLRFRLDLFKMIESNQKRSLNNVEDLVIEA